MRSCASRLLSTHPPRTHRPTSHMSGSGLLATRGVPIPATPQNRHLPMTPLGRHRRAGGGTTDQGMTTPMPFRGDSNRRECSSCSGRQLAGYRQRCGSPCTSWLLSKGRGAGPLTLGASTEARQMIPGVHSGLLDKDEGRRAPVGRRRLPPTPETTGAFLQYGGPRNHPHARRGSCLALEAAEES